MAILRTDGFWYMWRLAGLAFSASLLVAACDSGESPRYDDAAQRDLISAFTRARFRGDDEAIYNMLSNGDQKAIEAPLEKNPAGGVLEGVKPSALFKIVDVTNPYDIKRMDPEVPQQSVPKPGDRSVVKLTEENGTVRRYTLVWEDGRWKIDLGLAVR